MEHTPKKKRKGLILLLILFIVFIFYGVIYFVWGFVKKEMDKRAIAEYVTVQSRYQYYETGGIANPEILVSNGTDYLIDSVPVTITYQKADSSVFKTETIHFYHIAAHDSITKTAPDSKQGIALKLAIGKISSAELE